MTSYDIITAMKYHQPSRRLRTPLYCLVVFAILNIGTGTASAGSDENLVSTKYSTTVATALPLITTAASIGTLLAAAQLDSGGLAVAGFTGVLIGPSLGHIYTGNWKSPLLGVGLRLLGVAVIAYGLGGALSDEDGSSDNISLYYIAGGLIYSGSTILDILDAPASAERGNREASSLSFHPTPILGPDRSIGWGAALQTSF